MSNIYNSFLNVVRVTSELSTLQQTARDLFSAPAGFDLSSFRWAPHERDAEHEWLCVWSAISATVLAQGPRNNRPIGRLIICMDLFRETAPATIRTVLPHAKESFLTIVFIAGNNVTDQTYDPLSLQFDTDGWPLWAESYVPHEEGRLLQYLDENEKEQDQSWAKRAWLFAVPLTALDDRDCFRKEIVTPFWNALMNRPSGSLFPADSAALKFPLPQQPH
ncbi:hypothetical protein ABIB94_002782 [Bradyrhizobium sp. JR7.2]|uniref:hypothetical protein n=1 Tax=unclassified Bradyrhizobium TaxID=2631580 RepID=UPI003399ADE1